MILTHRFGGDGGGLSGEALLLSPEDMEVDEGKDILAPLVGMLRASPLVEVSDAPAGSAWGRDGGYEEEVEGLMVRPRCGWEQWTAEAAEAGKAAEAAEAAEEEYRLLVDIIGMEDHFGDMDFKVAGTRVGLTALQLDVKRPVPVEMLVEALALGRDARDVILNTMEASVMGGGVHSTREGQEDGREGGGQEDETQQVSSYKDSPNTPRHVALPIAENRRGDLIGPGGRTIKKLQESSGCEFDIQTDEATNSTMVHIFAKNEADAKKAVDYVGQIVGQDGVEPFDVGSSYEMEVRRKTTTKKKKKKKKKKTRKRDWGKKGEVGDGG
jgi:hypothetical protein